MTEKNVKSNAGHTTEELSKLLADSIAHATATKDSKQTSSAQPNTDFNKPEVVDFLQQFITARGRTYEAQRSIKDDSGAKHIFKVPCKRAEYLQTATLNQLLNMVDGRKINNTESVQLSKELVAINKALDSVGLKLRSAQDNGKHVHVYADFGEEYEVKESA